ncbi:MAG: T9SS type A sorting domain-containing protein [Ignavibacteriae bacterium]|nr:T9SS type A sorting domain-containing protein [Ignavibacteriota bacterium]MCB9206024.1 T9SS type A sorting domain-containing protein [Ignavibacteriales bacterium]MCB9209299.1 T9SS type A sorting domain-containing protein [Ignavibacteriales bacterium]MCB9257943.1 T9SS type A sorting domain-containing protein [Ignavibacteriales bacterium]
MFLRNNFIVIFQILVLSALLFNNVHPQLLRHDDFTIKNDYWYWRSDGNQSIPKVEDGLLHLQLNNAVDSFYCNTEIYDPVVLYLPGTQAKIRLKASKIHHGSRGWGFWDGHLDIFSLIYDYDVAWIMQQSSSKSEEAYNWFLFGSDGDTLTNRQTYNLQNNIDETEWHTYNIIWDINSVSLFIDDKFIYKTAKNLPNEEMRLDIWIDNRVINLFTPTDLFNNNVNNSEMYVDFVEISGINGPAIERQLSKNILLWESPNTFASGNTNELWKKYEFNSESSGNVLIFLTGSAEKYVNSSSDDDDLKFIFNSNDYGWDTQNSLNGNIQNGKGKSIIISENIVSGNQTLEIFSDVTPFLRDIIVVHSSDGSLIYSKHYNETAAEEDGIWKTITFDTENENDIIIIVSGTAYENDGISLALDNNDYGWEGINSFEGSVLEGTPHTVVINTQISAGSHKLELFKKGNPELYSIAIYGASNITGVNRIENADKNFIIKINPNPFNNSANISYTTFRSSVNKISIYNILGQKIATLIDEFQPVGTYNLFWDAKSQTSGLYFCVIESDYFQKVEKLLLLK